jgi:hypothetical protein
LQSIISAGVRQCEPAGQAIGAVDSFGQNVPGVVQLILSPPAQKNPAGHGSSATDMFNAGFPNASTE